MKNVKKLIISLSALAVCSGLGGGALTAATAKAAETANTVDTVNFQMESGAAIRLDTNAEDNKDENGIRYQITIPNDEYQALEKNTEYDSVSYGILIAPKDYAAANPLNEENVFGPNAVYDWAVKNPTTGEWDYTSDGSKTRIINFETDTLSPWSKDETVRTYFGSIVNLDDSNMTRDFVGVGYIKYEAHNTTDYVFAAENDNVRSMSQVARLAYVDTSDQALDQVTKNALKKTYIDNVYGTTFDFNEDKDAYLAKNCGNRILPDSEVSGVTALNGTFKNINHTDGAATNGDFRIDLGGEYQFKDIEKIVVKYRISYANKDSDSWWRIFLNDNTVDSQKLEKGKGVTFSSETGRSGGDMETYATATIEPATMLETGATGLTKEDYLYAISFGYRYVYDTTGNNIATINIDSIELKVFDQTLFEFNSEEALSLVTEGYNTGLVDLGDGNKALQADLCQWYNGGTRYNLKINLGGKYKVSEVANIELRYKVLSVSGSTVSSGWQVHFNVTESYTSATFNNRITGLTHNAYTAMNNFVSNYIYNEDGKNPNLITNSVSGTTGLSQEDYLNNIFFCVYGSGTNSVATIQIDYIRITLKA